MKTILLPERSFLAHYPSPIGVALATGGPFRAPVGVSSVVAGGAGGGTEATKRGLSSPAFAPSTATATAAFAAVLVTIRRRQLSHLLSRVDW